MLFALAYITPPPGLLTLMPFGIHTKIVPSHWTWFVGTWRQPSCHPWHLKLVGSKFQPLPNSLSSHFGTYIGVCVYESYPYVHIHDKYMHVYGSWFMQLCACWNEYFYVLVYYVEVHLYQWMLVCVCVCVSVSNYVTMRMRMRWVCIWVWVWVCMCMGIVCKIRVCLA